MFLEDSPYKIPFLEKIFKLDHNKKFKNKAQRYQHIIKSFLIDENKSFKITEIQEAVFDTAAQSIFKIYKFNDKPKTSSLIKKNYNHQFNTYLNELEEWKLVESKPAKSSKGGIDTKEFHLTKLGKTIALMIEFASSNNEQGIYSKLFNDWKSYLTDYSTSLDLFCLKYLDKCKESGLFNEFVEFFIKNVIYDTPNIKNNNDLFTQMTLVRFDVEQKNETLLELWKKSYYELDNTTQQLFSNHIRIHLNKMIASKAHNYGQYELTRYENRNLSDSIIAELCCSHCRLNYKYNPINVISYVSYAFIKTDKIVNQFLKESKCEKCKENKFEFILII